MSTRDWIKTRIQDFVMRQMNDLRPETVAEAEGDVLEVGFGTGLNLGYYPPTVKSLTGLDPFVAEGYRALTERIAAARFPIERCALRADGELPFDAGRFDTVITTWTLCSIPEPKAALAEMRRVLKPGGRYVFIEHGLAPTARTARWQHRVNPVWRCIADGCNINRPIDRLVEDSGFDLASIDRFRHTVPALIAHMYRGVATRAA
ncbi:MAG: class I SAM-dependent methyltransferase [Myxococcota bacterium]